ncbi:beta-eliminating lyase-related protein, partial [Thermodesulfobacteriota bacterium]
MISEPYKIKEVKKIGQHKPYERWNILKKVHFNTFHVSSDDITFDLVSRGMSSWSHYQKAAYMIGDEAYAGSRNYIQLEKNAHDILGLSYIVPTHNGIGAEKLLVTTLLESKQNVLSNRGRAHGLVPANGGIHINISCKEAFSYPEPDMFGGNVDLEQLENLLAEKRETATAYIHIETCPEALNGQPVSFANLQAIRKSADLHSVPLVIDISRVLENAFWIKSAENKTGSIMEIAREIISLADVVLMDASQDCRSDVGGFIGTRNSALFEKFRSQVVVFEGLHTYGGMTGRAMAVFAAGIEEMENASYPEWYDTQIGLLFEMLKKERVPAHRGTNGIA